MNTSPQDVETPHSGRWGISRDNWESPYDMSTVMEVELTDSSSAVLLEFVDYLGYAIEENPEATSGYSVTSPSGKRLGGFIANSIIKAWQTNPGGKQQGAGDAKKKGAAGGGAKKSPEEVAATKAAVAAEKSATAQENAARAISLIQPDVLEAKSKGQISGDAIQKMLDQTKAALDGVTDPKEIRNAIQKMKDNITLYKAQATKPPPTSELLAKAVKAIKTNLPSAQQLAGTKFDQMKIQTVIDAGTKSIENAASPEAAKIALRDMKQAISAEKIQQAKDKAAEVKSRKLSEDEPQTFMAQNQPRDAGGRFGPTGGHSGGVEKSGFTDGQLLEIAMGPEGESEWMPVHDFQLEKMAALNGFDGKPHIGSVDEVVASGGIELRRGVSDTKFAEAFKTGEYFAGRGMYGNGTYASGMAKLDAAEAHSGGGKGAVIRMALPKHAKIATDADMDEIMRSHPEDGHKEPRLREMLGADPGKLAMTLGYDAIHIKRKDYYVILNRAILTVEA